MELLNNIDKDSIPSIIKDPFSKNKIIRIMIVGNCQFEKTHFYSSVTFKNGETTGEQVINGSSLDDVYIKTANFVKSLE